MAAGRLAKLLTRAAPGIAADDGADLGAPARRTRDLTRHAPAATSGARPVFSIPVRHADRPILAAFQIPNPTRASADRRRVIGLRPALLDPERSLRHVSTSRVVLRGRAPAHLKTLCTLYP